MKKLIRVYKGRKWYRTAVEFGSANRPFLIINPPIWVRIDPTTMKPVRPAPALNILIDLGFAYCMAETGARYRSVSYRLFKHSRTFEWGLAA